MSDGQPIHSDRREPRRPSPKSRAKTWLGVVGAALGAFLAILNIQVVSSSLADIQGAIGTGVDEGGWIVTAFLVAEIVVIPLSGWLARVLSVRTYLLASTFLFLVFSVACTFAHSLGEMIVYRALQGLAGGSFIPLAFMIIMTRLPPSKHPLGLTIYSVSAIFAPAIGPVIGGYCNDNFGWQSIFLINLVPGALMVAMLWVGLDHERRQPELLSRADWVGIFTMAIGLGSLETVLEEGNKDDWFGSAFITRLALVAAIALIAFCVYELRYKHPLLNLRLFKRRNFALGSLANFFFGFSMYGWVYIVPIYLARVQGYDAQQIGGVLIWIGLPQLVLLPLMPRVLKRVDGRLLIIVGYGLFIARQLVCRAPLAGLRRAAIHLLQRGARRRASAGHDAPRGDFGRRHRARARGVGGGSIQHAAQSRRRHRHRDSADLSDQTGAVPLRRPDLAGLLVGGSDPRPPGAIWPKCS